MSKKESLHALELSVVPAVLASSCCLTVPALTLLGISFGENVLYEYKTIFRLLAILVLFISLIFYFYKKGIRTKDEYYKMRKTILFISIQTVLFACIFYIIFLQYIVPLLCSIAGITSCQSTI